VKLLVLGGTSDAIALCQQLLFEHDVIYSIKGLVRQPQLACEIHSGGFGGVKGLVEYLQAKSIDCLVDATHPYAINISHHANLAAQQSNTPCFHYLRPAWQAHADDHWIDFTIHDQLHRLLSSFDNTLLRPFFSIGQLSSEFLAKKSHRQHYIVRTAISHNQHLDKVTWIKSIGPFSLQAERQLFKDHAIDVLVSKNSGGNSVAAKIQVAREMKIPVFIQQRPMLQTRFSVFNTLPDLINAIGEADNNITSVT